MPGSYIATLYRIVADFSRGLMPFAWDSSFTNGCEPTRENDRQCFSLLFKRN